MSDRDLTTDTQTASLNGHAIASESPDASEVPTGNGTAAASEVEASTDDVATAAQSSEGAPPAAADAKHEETAEAKTDASGRPIPEQWKKRCVPPLCIPPFGYPTHLTQ